MFMNLRFFLRSSSDKWRLVIKPYYLKTYGFRAFSVIAPILWNDLPIDIRSIDDVNKFKSKLKTFLKHCKALSTEKYKRYINILLLLLLLLSWSDTSCFSPKTAGY